MEIQHSGASFLLEGARGSRLWALAAATTYCLAIFLSFTYIPHANAQYISQTFSGQDGGDGGPGTGALLSHIGAIAATANGEVYITDLVRHRVRMLNTPADVIINVAGNGLDDSAGVVPAGSLARSTSTRAPDTLALHPITGGFVFSATCTLYYVNATGHISYLGGTYCAIGGDNVMAIVTPLYFPIGISISPTTGDIFFIESTSQSVRILRPNGTLDTYAGRTPIGNPGDFGPAIHAAFASVIATAVDASGRVYVVDSVDQRVLIIYTNGTIAPFAGSGARGTTGDGGPAITASFDGPSCIHIMSSGNILVCDRDNVRIISLNGTIASLPGSGVPVSRRISSDARGWIYIAEIDKVWGVDAARTRALIAGDSTFSSGDNGLARRAELQRPSGVAVDLLTNITYIADTTNNRIRRVFPNGTMTAFAGTGFNGFDGDGGSSLLARLDSPVSVSTHPSGYVYIADSGNHRVRVVTPNGTIFTLAGNSFQGPAIGYTGDGGPGTAAQLHTPARIAIDGGGNLYVVDTGSHRIRKLWANGTVQLLAGAGGAVSTGDGGPALDANLRHPHGIAVDAAGNIYVSDMDDCTVQCINVSTGNITTVVGRLYQCGDEGDLGVSSMSLNMPGGIALDNTMSRLLIADTSSHKIRAVYPNGTFATFVGTGMGKFSGDGLPGTSASLQSPKDVAVGPDGTVYIADTGNYRIRGVRLNGTVFTLAGSGNYGLGGNGGPATSARMMDPVAIAVRPTGEVVVSDVDACTVRMVLLNGTIILVAGDSFACGYSGDGIPAVTTFLRTPVAVAATLGGDIYISDAGNNRIRFVSMASGIISTVLGSDGSNILASTTSLNSPSQIAHSTSGLYIADTGNCALRLVTGDGFIHTIVGTVGACAVSGLPYYQNEIRSVAVHPNGTVYFSAGACIRYLPSGSSVVTVAGTCTTGSFSGDGSAGTSARFASNIAHLAFDAAGTLFIADQGNYRVRAMYSTGVVVTVFGQGYGGWDLMRDEGLPADTVNIGAPVGVAVDALGNVLVAVPAMNSVRLAAVNVSAPQAIPSYSVTRTPAPTQSTSRTVSTSPTNSRSSSNSVSPSATESSSLTGSISGSASPTLSASFSSSIPPSTSVSTSVMPSGMTTASVTWTLSRTPTMSASASPSISVLASIQASTVGGSSLSPSPSTSVSRSLSSTPSPSPSVHALQLWFNDADTGALLQSSELRDGDVPGVLNVHAKYCPPPCIVQCMSANSSVARVYPRSLQLTQITASEEVHAELTVWAPFSTRGAESTSAVQCTAASSYTSVNVQRHNRRWPLIHDIVLLLDGGLVKSAWGSPVNVVTSLANATTEELMHYVAGVQYMWESVPTSASFSVSVVENTRLSLLADPGTFTTETVVRLNGVKCNVTGVSPSGDQLLLHLPSKAELCPNVLPTSDCGYLSLSVSTHTDGTKQGATLSCPPFCPNDFPGSVPLSAGLVGGVEVFVPALETSEGGGPPVQIPVIRLPATGLYLTESCTAAGFVDPSTGICGNASDPRHRDCGFGAGGACTACPQHCVCPGGFRAVPVPGYYAASERTGIIIECPAPSLERCVGWDAMNAEVACGPGYSAPYAGCSACAPGYYPSQDGTCATCPTEKPSVAQVLLPVVEFLGMLAAACALVFGIVFAIAKIRHASLVGLPKRILQLGVWTFSTVQLVAQVGQAAPPGLPAVILAAYQQLSVFQFRGVATPSACIPGFPYVNETSAMTIALFLTVLTLTSGVLLWKADKPATKWALCFRLSVLACTLMYPTVVNDVLAMLACTPTRVGGPALFALTGEIRDMGFDFLYDIPVLSSNPTTACYVGSHTYVAGVAWCTLLFYCIAFPCCVMLMVRHRMRPYLSPSPSSGNCVSMSSPASSTSKSLAAAKLVGQNLAEVPAAAAVPSAVTSDPLLSPFVSGDYIPVRFWFFGMDRVYIASLAIIQSALSDAAAPVKFALICIVLSGAASLLCFFPPYTPQTQWKWIVKLYSLLLSLLAACVNFTASMDSSNPALLPLGGIVAAGCFFLFAILIVSFFRDVYRSASMPLAAPTSHNPTPAVDDAAWVHANPLSQASDATETKAADDSVVSFRKRPAAAIVVLAPDFATMEDSGEAMVESHVHNSVHRLSRNAPVGDGSSASVARKSGLVLKPLLSRRQQAGSHRAAR